MDNIKLKLILNNISLFCVYLFPISLVAGPFVAELFMNIVVIIFIYSCFEKKKWSFVKTKFFKIFIIFYLYIVINSIISDYKSFILLKNIFYFRYGIFIIAVLNLIETNEFFVKRFFKILILSILVMVIDGYIQFFIGQNILGYESSRPDRLSGFFDDELVIGSFLSKLLFLSIGLFLYCEKNLNKFYNLLSIFTIFITFILIFLSGERAALLITLFGFITILFCLFRYKYLLFFSLLLFSLVSITFNDNEIKKRHIDQTLIHTKPIKVDGNFFDNFRYYGAIYNTAFNAFKQKKIFGQGANSYRYFCGKKGIEAFNLNPEKKYSKKNIIAYANGCTTHPHQFYLQLLSELGFLGFFYIFSIFCYFTIQLIKFNYFKIFYKKIIYKDYEIMSIINIFLILWPITTNGNFFNNWSNMLMILPIVFAINFLSNRHIKA